MKNNELSLPDGVAVFSRGALEFTRTPTSEEWLQIGRYVSASRSCSIRWLSDWRRTGRRNFGDEAVQQAEFQLEMEFKDLKAATAIEALEGSTASAASDEHAFVVAKYCGDSEQAEKWLKISDENDLSAKELKESILFGSVVRLSEKKTLNANDNSTGLVTIEGIAAQFALWRKKVEEDGFPTQWDSRRLEMIRDLLAPIGGVARDVSVLILQKGGK